MIRKLPVWAVFLAVSCLVARFSTAQEFVKMNDEQFIELAVDLVRKGVQQEDTTKVFQVFAPEVIVRGQEAEDKALLSQRLQAVFDNGYERTMSLERPVFSRDDNPLSNSDFWDFDILDPHISINGDTAIVSCELVLWGVTEQGTGNSGQVSETFVFVSPKRPVPLITSDRYGLWSASPNRNDGMIPRSWKLMGFDSLLEFLEKHGGTTPGQREKTGEEGQ